MPDRPASPQRRMPRITVEEYEREAAERVQRIRERVARSKHLVRESHRLIESCNGYNPYLVWRARQVVLNDLLIEAIDATAADFGNIQLLDSSNYTLRIVAQRGFNEEFLNFFAVVRGLDSACGRAMARQARVIVPDVSCAPMFMSSASGDVMLRAEARAVQSTPLFDHGGRFVGMLSTHYRNTGHPSQRALQQLDKVIQRYFPQMTNPWPNICPVCSADHVRPIERRATVRTEGERNVISGVLAYQCSNGHTFVPAPQLHRDKS